MDGTMVGDEQQKGEHEGRRREQEGSPHQPQKPTADAPARSTAGRATSSLAPPRRRRPTAAAEPESTSSAASSGAAGIAVDKRARQGKASDGDRAPPSFMASAPDHPGGRGGIAEGDVARSPRRRRGRCAYMNTYRDVPHSSLAAADPAIQTETS